MQQWSFVVTVMHMQTYEHVLDVKTPAHNTKTMHIICRHHCPQALTNTLKTECTDMAGKSTCLLMLRQLLPICKPTLPTPKASQNTYYYNFVIHQIHISRHHVSRGTRTALECWR